MQQECQDITQNDISLISDFILNCVQSELFRFETKHSALRGLYSCHSPDEIAGINYAVIFKTFLQEQSDVYIKVMCIITEIEIVLDDFKVNQDIADLYRM